MTCQQSLSVRLSAEVAHALVAVSDPAEVVDRALRRELGLLVGGPGASRPPGRPRKHSVEDLADCLGSHNLTTGEFQRRAAETLDISRASFFRLLDRGRREWLFRQRATDGRWVAVPKSPRVTEASSGLPALVGELADRALSETP